MRISSSIVTTALALGACGGSATGEGSSGGAGASGTAGGAGASGGAGTSGTTGGAGTSSGGASGAGASSGSGASGGASGNAGGAGVSGDAGGAGASGNAGGATGGSSAVGGASGAAGIDECEALARDVDRRLEDARRCCPECDSIQCTAVVEGSCCPVVVGHAGTAETTEYLEALDRLRNHPRCAIACPEIPCPQPRLYRCVPTPTGDGRCE